MMEATLGTFSMCVFDHRWIKFGSAASMYIVRSHKLTQARTHTRTDACINNNNNANRQQQQLIWSLPNVPIWEKSHCVSQHKYIVVWQPYGPNKKSLTSLLNAVRECVRVCKSVCVYGFSLKITSKNTKQTWNIHSMHAIHTNTSTEGNTFCIMFWKAQRHQMLLLLLLLK